AGNLADAEGIIAPIIYGLTLAPAADRVTRMSLYALGLNHQTAPLAVRERVVFHVERLREALDEMKRGLAQEAAILSTCNRTELYVERIADRKSTRLNSSHQIISYAVFCLKKKKKTKYNNR